MSLVALDGPSPKERVHDAKFIGYLGDSNASIDFDLGGINMSEFAKSGRTSVPGAIATKKNPTANLQALITHIDSEIANPTSQGLQVSVMNDAMKELQQWQQHNAATPQQKAEITDLIAKITTLRDYIKPAGSAIGFSPAAGWPTSIPSTVTGITELSPGISIGTTPNADGTKTYWWFYETPLGVAYTNGSRTGHALSDNSAAAQQAAFADLFNQMFSTINAWITANGFAGSGNVQTASKNSGESTFNLAANVSDGWGGYLEGLNTYRNYLNLITAPGFQVTTPSKNLLQKVAQDVSTAAKTVSKTVQNVAKQATKVVNTVIKAVKTVELAPARTAFLGLVAVNAFGLASSFAKISNDDLNAFWGNFAPDNPTGMQTYVNKGKGLPAILGPREREHKRLSGRHIGIAPAALAAVAVPILTAALAYLKSKGIISPAAAAAAQAGINSASQELGNTPPGTPGVGNATIPVTTVNGVPVSAGVIPPGFTPGSPGTPGSSQLLSSQAWYTNPVVLGGGALLLIGMIIIAKKK